MNLKRYLIFLPDKEAGKDTAKLRFRVKWSGGSAAFSVGYRVEVDKWEVSTQRCRISTTHGKKKIQANIINREIQRYELAANSVLNGFESKDKTPTNDEFRDAFNLAINRTLKVSKLRAGSTFYEIFDMFVLTAGAENSWSEDTVRKFNNVKEYMQAFDSSLSFNSLSDQKMTDFVKYLNSIGHRNSTTDKNISFVRWFLRWCHKKELYHGRVHETFRPKLKGVDSNSKEVIYLTWDELHHLLNLKIPDTMPGIERVRDVFCFCCFTSLRYSDVKKLCRSDIRDNYIRVVTKKTDDGLTIDLNKYSRAILDKYADCNFPEDRALPVVSNSSMNWSLKELGKLAGFNDMRRIVFFVGRDRYEEVHPLHELLTTHCGRRTFIVNALYLGIPAEVVMKWTGHSDFEAMKPYVKIVDELKSKEMAKFDQGVKSPILKKGTKKRVL